MQELVSLLSNIEKRKEITNELTKQRREIYQQYVNLIIDVFAAEKTVKKKSQATITTELFEFYKKYILFASPNVIRAFSDYFQLIYKQEEDSSNLKKQMELMTKIMLEMRKDLGLKNKRLGKNGEILIRALIKDFDNYW